jgi:hypothetical protein
MGLNFSKFLKGLRLKPNTTTAVTQKGDIEVLDSSGKMNFHNGTTASPVVTEAHTATLTDKTIDADVNTITNIEDANIKASAGIDATKIASGDITNAEFQTLNGITSNIQAQINTKMDRIVSVDNTIPRFDDINGDLQLSGIVINDTDQIELSTGKTIDGIVDLNLNSDSSVIVNATDELQLNTSNNDVTISSVTGGVNIAAGTKVTVVGNTTPSLDDTYDLGSGLLKYKSVYVGTSIETGAASISTAELGYLDGVTSSIQTQLNTNASNTSTVSSNLSSHTAATSAHGVSGAVVGTTDTQTVTNKTVGDALTMTQVATPSNPAASKNKLYFKSDDKLYKLTSAGVEAEVGAGGSGANTTLSNLTATTSINQDLVPDVTDTRNLGSTTKQYDTLYARTVKSTVVGNNSNNINLKTENTTIGASGVVTISSGTATSGNSGQVNISSGSITTGITSGNVTLSSGASTTGPTGSVTINSGSSSTNGLVGDVQIQTGSTGNATQPNIQLSAGNQILLSHGAGLTISNITTPANPASGTKLYPKADGKFYSLTTAGVESQLGGSVDFTNLITLTSAYAPDNSTNANAELTVGSWVAYADAAATAPVDMTGGSPNTTITRNTSSPMNGVADFKVTVTTGASRQGEGVSCLVYIPPAYQGKTLQFTAPFATTGTILEDDFRIYAYDVTNSELITPFTYSKILGANGTIGASITPKSTCAQLRVGIHIARTSTGAATINFDDVYVGMKQSQMGVAGSDWISYTPTTAGIGTPTITYAQYRRIGSSIEVSAKIVTGTVAASAFKVSLPSGITANVSVDSLLEGTFGGSYNGSNFSGVVPIVLSSDPTNIQFGRNNSSTVFTPINGNALANNGDVYTFTASVPVVGWSSNVSMSESSVFNISSYLANGTRVTSTPTKLGEYRTRTRNTSAQTATDNAPGTSPSIADGMKFFTRAYNTAGNSTDTELWDIYVGKNKTIKPLWYNTTGRTGNLCVDTQIVDGADGQVGTQHTYDPTTGVFSLWPNAAPSATNGGAWVGKTGMGAQTTSGYFDVVVSENAAMVSAQNPRSSVRISNGNGFGSTNTKIRRFSTTVSSTGTAITYADSAADGATFIINESGVYAVSYSDLNSGAGAKHGISVNSTQLTTSIASITNADILAVSVSATGSEATTSYTGIFNAGDVVRAHTDGTQDATSGGVRFTITKVSN